MLQERSSVLPWQKEEAAAAASSSSSAATAAKLGLSQRAVSLDRSSQQPPSSTTASWRYHHRKGGSSSSALYPTHASANHNTHPEEAYEEGKRSYSRSSSLKSNDNATSMRSRSGSREKKQPRDELLNSLSSQEAAEVEARCVNEGW